MFRHGSLIRLFFGHIEKTTIQIHIYYISLKKEIHYFNGYIVELNIKSKKYF